MEKLTEKKRKWIIHQFRCGRSATSIAKIQKISRQMVYKLARKYKEIGAEAYKTKKKGRPPIKINPKFIRKVTNIRKKHDYGSQKIHFLLKKEGHSVSQRQIQKILDSKKLTKPCLKRRGQRKYVRYEWPISNHMWHTDWSQYKCEWYLAFIDDKSRKVMSAGKFKRATQSNALFILYQAILMNEASPMIILSDKGTQFYNSKKNKKGIRTPSLFEQELNKLGIEFWTSRRNHPQTNGKIERWFGTMKSRLKKHPDETLQDFVEWYNEERIHHALDYKTPEKTYWENV